MPALKIRAYAGILGKKSLYAGSKLKKTNAPKAKIFFLGRVESEKLENIDAVCQENPKYPGGPRSEHQDFGWLPDLKRSYSIASQSRDSALFFFSLFFWVSRACDRAELGGK